MPTSEIPAPTDQHTQAATRMSVSRGALLSVLLGPIHLLGPSLETAIEHNAQNLDWALNNIAIGYEAERNRSLYLGARAELLGAVTHAGITAHALNALQMMLDDYHREAEFLGTQAPAPLSD
ncbi:hypothetical protein [Nocardia xishanensis]